MLAMSSESMIVRTEFPDAIRASASSSEMPFDSAICAIRSGVASVRVSPGCTTVTLIPSGPNSSARFLVIAATDTLRIEPTVLPEPRAASPDTLMIRPQPCSCMYGAAAREQRR